MGFRMNCDRCGRFIKNISPSELKNQINFGDEVICPSCKKWEVAAQKKVEKLITEFRKDLEKYAGKYKELILAEVRGAQPDGEDA